MEEADFQEVDNYISHRQNKVAQYIETRPIMDLCMVAKRTLGPRVSMRGWEQESMDLDRMWTVEREAEKPWREEETDVKRMRRVIS